MSKSLPGSTSTRRASRHRHRAHRVRFAPAAVIGGVAASAAIALSMSGTLAGFVAQITNNNNTAATGVLTMQETGGGFTCNSSTSALQANQAVCSTINKYGGSVVMVPGTAVTTSITITNTGTVPANTFTLAAQGCTQSNNGTVNGTATDLCDKMQVSLTQAGTPVTGATNVSLTNFGGKTYTLAGPIAPQASATFAFSVVLPTQNASATAANPFPDNAYQGLKASQNLVWTFTS